MKKVMFLAVLLSMLCSSPIKAQNEVNIGKSNIKLSSNLMTPEALWAMGRVSSYAASPDGKQIVYQVGYYSVKENKSHHILYIMDADGKNTRKLTTSTKNETDAAWIENGKRIAFITGGQLWSMNPDGSGRKQLTKDAKGIEGYKFSPNGKKVILIKELPYHGTIKKNPDDLPKATGRLATDMNYRHWDHYVESILHPFVADVAADGTINEGVTSLKENLTNVRWRLLEASNSSIGASILKTSPTPVVRKKA